MKHHVSSSVPHGTHHDHFGTGLMTSCVVFVVLVMSLLVASPVAQIYQTIAAALQ